MRAIYGIVGAGVLAVGLAGWAALAWAQGPGVPGPLPPEPAAATQAVTQVSGTAPPSQPLPPPPPGLTGLPSTPVPAVPVMTGTPAMPAPPAPPMSSGVTPGPVMSSLPPQAGSLMPAQPAMPAQPVQEGVAPEPTQTPDNPVGRQEPAISIEWVGPPTAKVGQAGDYALVVRNACNIPVQQVLVRVKVPAGMSVQATEPKANADGQVLVWELGTLLAKQEKSLLMKLVADQRGDVLPQAWVTFTGSSVMRVKVREPKLILKASAPEKSLIGDAVAFSLTVTNPGDGSADQVKIHALLSEGLEHARGNKVDFDIGNLAAGESRSVQLICAAKAGGVQKCDGSAEAEGGLKSADGAQVNVITPRLDLVVEGPSLRYLDRKALYTLKVTNPGDAPASNVTVSDMVPDGFKVLAASDGGRHDFSTRTVSWFIGEIGPGQTHEVKLEVQAINPGVHKLKAAAVGARGLRAEAEKTTRIEGLSALLLEMIDTEDPIEVGGETAYEIRVTNTGSKTETDIRLVAVVPDKMEFKSLQGPVRYHLEGKTIVFDPIEKLAPRADALFRVNVRATDAGTVRFKIQMTSTNLTDPVIKMEATRIYSDAPEPASGPAEPQK